MRYHSINGDIVADEDAHLYLGDIGFRRGYAAFDYLRVVAGRPLFLEDHLDRFERSCRLLELTLPLSREALKAHLRQLIERNELGDAGVQLYLTGGVAADGFTPADPTLAIYVGPIRWLSPELYRSGAKLITHRYRRDLPEAKTTNYLMAVSQAGRIRREGAVDALYHDDGLVLETTRSNVFVVGEGGALATPGEGILKGVTRTNLLRALAGEVPVEERDVTMVELRAAREVFITGTTKGALPITAIDDQAVGDGGVGATTQRVMTLFEEWVARYLEAAGVV